MVGDWMSESRQAKRDAQEFEFKKDLASHKQLQAHIANVHQQNSDGTYSPLAYVIAFVVLLFGVTYCMATLTCFFDNPEQIVHTKDPAENTRAISILFGSIKWDLANNRILAMSKAGLGFLMLYPVVFILSAVIDGGHLKRGR